MSTIRCEVEQEIWCDQIEDPASLVEERVYLGDSLAEQGVHNYRVIKRRCSRALECNIAEHPCQWSYLNPTGDVFFAH